MPDRFPRERADASMQGIILLGCLRRPLFELKRGIRATDKGFKVGDTLELRECVIMPKELS